jgi:hypothetical protein
VARRTLSEMRLPTKARVTSDLVPDLQLAHGRAVWVLDRMGFAAGVTPGTFNHYVKSLRKLGVPFARGEFGTGSRKPARYSFNHLMELSLALTLRIYGVLPDPVLDGASRPILRYQRARGGRAVIQSRQTPAVTISRAGQGGLARAWGTSCRLTRRCPRRPAHDDRSDGFIARDGHDIAVYPIGGAITGASVLSGLCGRGRR